MAVTGFFHHIGTFLLLAATALLIVTTISSPVVKNLSLMTVQLGNSTAGHHTSVTFGTFGHCILDTRSGDGNGNMDFCSPSQVGYSPAEVMTDSDGTDYSDYARDTSRALTKVMILHPVATGITFIAFLLSLGAGVVGSFLASLVALLAFIVTAVVLITDFVLFSIVRTNVNNNNNSGSSASYSTAMWTLLAAAVLTLIATVVVFFTCCSGRLHKRRNRNHAVKDPAYVSPPATRTRRRRWF